MKQVIENRTPLQRLLWLGAMAKASGGKLSEFSASGNPCVFETDVARPLKRLALSLLPRQSGTGDPSPENIRPLLPWGEVGTWHGGKNLFHIPSASGTNAGVTYSYDAETNTLTKSGTSNNNSGYNLGSFYLSAGTYIFSAMFSSDESGTNVYLREIATNTNIGYIGKQKPTQQFTTNGGEYYFRVASEAGAASGSISEFQIELGNTVTAYESPSITPHPVDLTGITSPVYGATLDLTTGEVWGTYACEDVIGNISVNGNLPYGGAQIKWIPTLAKKYASDSSHQNEGLYCNTFDSSEPLPSGASHVTGRSTNGNVFFNMPQEVTNLQEASTWFNNNPTQVAYPLATPVLLATLTPQQVSALVGVNTVWSDADNVDVTYLKKG